MRALGRALASVWHEWIEAPWFVILTIVVIAFVGPGVIWAAWQAISDVFS
ncbi:MAG: hypothetical protein ACR2P0_03960 [Acidimicrobiales bacterium]